MEDGQHYSETREKIGIDCVLKGWQSKQMIELWLSGMVFLYMRKFRRTCTSLSQRPSLNLPQLRSTRSEIKPEVHSCSYSPSHSHSHSHSHSLSTCRNWVTTIRAFAFSGRETRLADHILNAHDARKWLPQEL